MGFATKQKVSVEIEKVGSVDEGFIATKSQGTGNMICCKAIIKTLPPVNMLLVLVVDVELASDLSARDLRPIDSCHRARIQEPR